MKKTTYTPYSADNDEIDFGQQLRVIWTNKYKILAALLAGGNSWRSLQPGIHSAIPC